MKDTYNDEEKKKKKGAIFIFLGIALLLCAAIVGGAIAYFTSTTDVITNKFDLGNLTITTLESSFEEQNAKNLRANASVPKNPQIKNDGDVSAYVFLVVDLPNANVSLVDSGNKVLAAAATDLVELEGLDTTNWNEIERETVSTKTRIVYAYVKDDGILAKGDTTEELFTSFKLKNIAEGQVPDEQNIIVTGIGIQSDNVSLTGEDLKAQLKNVYDTYLKAE